jgi:hypothetical protein
LVFEGAAAERQQQQQEQQPPQPPPRPHDAPACGFNLQLCSGPSSDSLISPTMAAWLAQGSQDLGLAPEVAALWCDPDGAAECWGRLEGEARALFRQYVWRDVAGSQALHKCRALARWYDAHRAQAYSLPTH